MADWIQPSDLNADGKRHYGLPAPTISSEVMRFGDVAVGAGYLKSSGLLGTITAVATIPASDITGLFYQTVRQAGSALTQRASLNVLSGELLAADNGGSAWTDLGLPNVGPGAGTIGSGGIATITLDAKGRVTTATTATYVPTSRTLTTTSPIRIAGGASADLSADRTLSLLANGIDNTFIRQSAGLSVIGRSANTTGNVADIVGTDGQILRVSGTTLGFGSILASSVSGLFYQTIANAGTPLTQRDRWNASTGLFAVDNAGSTRTDVTVNLSTGVPLGQSAIGGTGAGENLTLVSTGGSPKGKVLNGTWWALDEVNLRMGVGTQSPSVLAHLRGGTTAELKLYIENTSGGVSDVSELTLINSSGSQGRVYFTSGSYTGAEAGPGSMVFASTGGAGSRIYFSANGTGTLRMSAGQLGGYNLTSASFVSSSTPTLPSAPTVFQYSVTPPSTASAASLGALYQFESVTITLTGSTTVTGSGFAAAYFGAPTVTDASAVTIDTMATVKIQNAPFVSGSATITAPYALWIGGGDVRMDGLGLTGFVKNTNGGVLSIDAATYVPTTRTIFATSPVRIAGGASADLSADRTLSISANGIDNTLIRQGGATSVIGRSANSTGNVADIAAAGDGDILRRSAGALGFGTIAAASVTGLFYQTAQNAGVPLTQRGAWNASTGLTAVDNGGSTRTDVTATISTGLAGGQTAYGGIAASESLYLSSTSHATKGQVIFGASGSASGYSEALGQLYVGGAGGLSTSPFVVTSSLDGTVHHILGNTSTGTAARTGLFVGNQTSAIGGSYIEIFSYGSLYTASGLQGPGVGEILHVGTSDFLIGAFGASGDIIFTSTSSRTERMRIANGGNVSVANLTAGGVVYATASTGVLKLATSAEIAAKVSWPSAAQVLVSSGTTTAPVGDTHFTYDTATDLLTLAAGAAQAWYNLDGATNYERIQASWSSNIWNLTSSAGGTGTIRPMKIDGNGAELTLDGLDVRLAAPVVMAYSDDFSFYFTEGTNYERLRLYGDVASNYWIVSEKGGSGTKRDLYIQAPNVVVGPLTAGGEISISTSGIILDEQPTVASGTSATLDAIQLLTGATITGSTAITTAGGFNAIRIYAPSYSGSMTITNAATLHLDGAPAISGGGSIMNAYTIWVDAGLSRFDGNGTHVFELPLDGTTAGSHVGRVPILVNGATRYLHTFDG